MQWGGRLLKTWYYKTATRYETLRLVLKVECYTSLSVSSLVAFIRVLFEFSSYSNRTIHPTPRTRTLYPRHCRKNCWSTFQKMWLGHIWGTGAWKINTFHIRKERIKWERRKNHKHKNVHLRTSFFLIFLTPQYN